MKSSVFIALAAAFSYTNALSIPHVFTRYGPPSIPGIDFTDDSGKRAAAAAAPVWLFGREDINGNSPCYPDRAVNLAGNGINPGTAGPSGSNPGANCRGPGPANGKFSPGGSFPNYITAVWCGGKAEWRINYSLYYVHDGAGSQGHRHDWESATVVFKEDSPGVNMFHRDSLVLSQHKKRATKGWGDIQSVNMPNDLKDTDGQYRTHPKVYVGFFKHANFFDKDTRVEIFHAAAAQSEYRSDDWYFMGDINKGDFVAGSTLYAYKGKYGSADSDPGSIQHKICGF